MEKTKKQLSVFQWLLIIFGIFIFVGFIAGNSNNSDSNTNKDLQYYEIGDIVNFDNWQIKVVGVKNTTKLSNDYKTTETQNNYVVVELEIKNLQNEPTTLLTSKEEVTLSSYKIYSTSIFELYDGNNTYISNSELEVYTDSSFNIDFDKVNPNTTIKYEAVFETDKPTTEKNFIFKLSNSNKGIKLY